MNLYLDNSNVIELRSLTNSVTGVVDTGASVSVTIQDASGTPVTGQVWPVSMGHDSDGTYRATLDSSINLIAGRKYTAVVTATGSGSEVGEWNCSVIAQDRLCD
jgi:hypothetical protein